MALLGGFSQVASIAQLAGVDACGLISMIVEAAKTTKRNQETCQLLARRARMIRDLLQQLHSMQLMRHTETRNPVEQLEETLRHAYMLIKSCQGSSYLHSCFMGGKLADQLRDVQNEITFYLQLIPLVSFIDTARTWEHVLSRDRPLCSEETTDELHAVHNLEREDRIGVLRETKFKDSGTHPPQKSAEEQTEGEIMNMGELVNLNGGGRAGILYFSFSEIMTATDNLSYRNLIGIGGFGYVYKGTLSNGVDIAVKRHNTSSYQRPKEFRTEIEAIPDLRHKNIISLLGCCVQGGEKILIYEYMANKSLASIIADETKRKLQNWSKRLQIIKAIADGIAYLHGHSQMCIVHRDINPNNILLDHEMNAKISDFGLAIKLAPNTTAEVIVCGTYGYADPEYVATGKISEKADVYSFGIILLEVITGKLFWSYKMKAKGTSLGLLLPDYSVDTFFSLHPAHSSLAPNQRKMALVGQVATVTQLVGVDAYGLITMIAEAARTVRRNRATCLQLARRVEMIGALLRQLHAAQTQLMQRPETRNPMEELEATLRRAYLLVRACQRRGYVYRCFMGARHADELREVQGEIVFYLQLFPLVSYVDATLTWARILSKAGDDASFQEAPMNCKGPGSKVQLPAQLDQSLSLPPLRKD